MMTRGQVAKRLGVSVAAVRKFEGSELQPEMHDGRWLFDPDEVEGLARLRANGGGRLTTPFDDPFSTRRGTARRTGDMPDDFDDLPSEFAETGDAMQRIADSNSQLARVAFGIEQSCRRLTPFGGRDLGYKARDVKQEIAAEVQTQWEEHQALSVVDNVLSELEELSPRQLRRFLRSDEDIGEFLDCLEQLADDD